MHRVKIGVSACPGLSGSIIKNADFVEIKKISASEVSRYKSLTDKPLLFHMQFSGDNSFYMPTACDLSVFLPEITEAYRAAYPVFTSFHFGLSSRTITVDPETNVAVAGPRLLTRDEITYNLEKNLRIIREALPDTVLLVENQEFIPDRLSRGAYRYIQEPDFFSSHVTRWNGLGILDGIVFDVPHALVTAANHPRYNDPVAHPPADTEDCPYNDLHHGFNAGLLSCFKRYTAEMPLGLIREIHISGVERMPEGVWVDSHKEIGDLELKAFKIILEAAGKTNRENIPLTLEYSRDVSKITGQLNMLRDFCAKN
jgi:hypothetical protein